MQRETPERARLVGKVMLVIGATSGIGATVARRVAAEGAVAHLLQPARRGNRLRRDRGAASPRSRPLRTPGPLKIFNSWGYGGETIEGRVDDTTLAN
jgi:NAD(P)-dependent dehydrogenase (short-subunit alcohol dehydrogenase family)